MRHEIRHMLSAVRYAICSMLPAVLYTLNAVRCTLYFLTNKPNSPIVQIHLTNLSTMNYAIFTSLIKVKNKPNSNPITANTKPIKAKCPISSRIASERLNFWEIMNIIYVTIRTIRSSFETASKQRRDNEK